MRKFTFLYFRHKGKCQDTQRGYKKGRPEGSPYGYAVRGVTGSREKAHASALSVDILDTTDVTSLSVVIQQHKYIVVRTVQKTQSLPIFESNVTGISIKGKFSSTHIKRRLLCQNFGMLTSSRNAFIPYNLRRSIWPGRQTCGHYKQLPLIRNSISIRARRLICLKKIPRLDIIPFYVCLILAR